ncbi:division plane positioning ATPase MipZ [Providencia alcalifaciens]|uniref:division plane positioning ATPase MipZ n=1 Tax=Providencia alcalifaciens TaxID=126385 RepID=UPI001CC46972
MSGLIFAHKRAFSNSLSLSVNISDEIKCLEKRCDVVIVDCVGHSSLEFRSALTVADVLLTLVKPSSS